MCYILGRAAPTSVMGFHRGGKLASNFAHYALPRLRPLRLFSRECSAEFSLALRNATDDLVWPAIPAAESPPVAYPGISNARRILCAAQARLGCCGFFLLPRRDQRYLGDGRRSPPGRC